MNSRFSSTPAGHDTRLDSFHDGDLVTLLEAGAMMTFTHEGGGEAGVQVFLFICRLNCHNARCTLEGLEFTLTLGLLDDRWLPDGGQN